MSGFNHLFKLYVSGSTIWLCFPPRWTLAIIYPITILVFVIYGILNHGPLKKYQENLHNNTSHKYERVSSSPNNDSNSDKSRNSYWIKQVQFFFDVLPYFGYLFATFCSFHIAISSVLTTLSFPSSPFRIRDHFHYYRLSNDVGLILGGSEILMVSCFCPRWLDFFRIRKLWILVLLNVGHLVFFIFAAWYHFVPNVNVLLLLCATHGFIFGSTTVQVTVAVAEKFQNSHKKGLALNITFFGGSVGRLASELIGIFVEAHLRTALH